MTDKYVIPIPLFLIIPDYGLIPVSFNVASVFMQRLGKCVKLIYMFVNSKKYFYCS